MKYKLLKNIPLANEGDVVELVYDDGVLPYIINEDNRILTYLDDDTIDEWIQPITQEHPYDINVNGSFWFIDYDNCDIGLCHIDTNSNYNNYYLPALKVGNVYIRKEQAENTLNKIKALNAIKEYCYKNNIELYTDDEVHEILRKNSTNTGLDMEYWIIAGAEDTEEKFIPTHYVSLFIDTPLKFKNNDDVYNVIKNCSSELKLLFNVN